MWFHPGTILRLADVLEIPPALVAEAMGNDVKQAWGGNNYPMEGIVHETDGDWHVDFWGVKWVKQGEFNQIAECPLAGADREQVLAYRFPYEHLDELMGNMEPITKQSDRFFIGCDVSPCAFEMYWRLRGMENAMLEIAADPELIAEMFRRSADFAIALSREAINRYRLDWLWTGDDAASQLAMLMSRRSWRDLIKPQLKRVVDVGKSKGLYVAFHSCGAIRSIIGDLIEIGVDVLNPIQCNCPGMDPLELKREFGDKVAFMGGVDTQGVLPNGTADEVRRATAKLVDGMTADGGGYILAASHTVPPETPLENIFAMYGQAGISKEEILGKAADIRSRLAAQAKS
ncbi:MAG: hypothetical protein HQ546_05675 [Planctomycetes bacterium]|nr:hypothetical protein [Planctomycetota bacterium]